VEHLEFSGFFVYDTADGTLVGPWWVEALAQEYANAKYGDDGDGTARVIRATMPE